MPLYPFSPAPGVLFCLHLRWGTGWTTWLQSAVFLAAGALVYAFYGRRHSRLAGTSAAPSGRAEAESALTPEREPQEV